MLWSIDNANFDNQYRYISALAAGAQVPQTDSTTTPPWSFQPTMDALRRNRETTLAGPRNQSPHGWTPRQRQCRPGPD
jgi:hypothetical protein